MWGRETWAVLVQVCVYVWEGSLGYFGAGVCMCGRETWAVLVQVCVYGMCRRETWAVMVQV